MILREGGGGKREKRGRESEKEKGREEKENRWRKGKRRRDKHERCTGEEVRERIADISTFLN